MFTGFPNRDFIEIFIDRMNYKDVIVLVAMVGLCIIFYFDYSFWQKLEHARYLVVFVAGVAFMGYLNSRLHSTNTVEEPKQPKLLVNDDFDVVLKAIEPLKFVDEGIYDSVVKDTKKFMVVYHNSLDKNPNSTCNAPSGDDTGIIWYNVKQAKKYKKRILRNMHKFPQSVDYQDKLNYQIQQMEVTLNAYMRAIVRACDQKGQEKKRNLMTYDTQLIYPSHPNGYQQ